MMRLYTGLAFLLPLTATAGIDEYNAASEALCQKARQCTYANMDEQNLTPEMRQMVEGMLDNICNGMKKIAEPGENDELIEPATACMESMADLSCDAFEEQTEASPACQRFEKKAKAYQDANS